MTGLIFLKCLDLSEVKRRTTSIIDFKKLSQDILKNRTINTLGDRVNWLKVKRFRIEKASPSLVKYSYTHAGDYLDINIHGKGRPSKLPLLKKAYSAMLPISEKKYNDLKHLCTNEVIPIKYHAWYLS
ncbi:hypothetical protein QE152_g5518 [Popillia japonica]|uniref:Uncharacterized protein n=1 Tax=Popillia japonica TaxID=7064 RepID=A0AAW1MMV9_POPJA